MTGALQGHGELYVYYRVPTAQAALAVAQVRAVQQRLQTEMPQLTARLLRRIDADTSPETQTWMEIYQHPHGLDGDRLGCLRAALADVPAARQGPRHEERFAPFADSD